MNTLLSVLSEGFHMKISLAALTIISVALGWFGLQSLDTKSLFGPSLNSTGSATRIDASISQLQQDGSSRDTRLAAARFIASNANSVTPDLVHQLGQPLLKARDVAIRKEVADVMRQLAARHTANELQPAQFEPQMLEILLAAYNGETNADVRINIVRAAGQMNHPDALLILDNGTSDANPAVREAAQESRTERERRMLAARSG